MTGAGVNYDIDPAVFIDDDGQAYIYWGNGAVKGYKLKENMIELDSKRDMKVQTFSKGVEAGTPARNLYQAFGFEDHKNMGKNPAGIETVLMIKKQKNVLI